MTWVVAIAGLTVFSIGGAWIGGPHGDFGTWQLLYLAAAAGHIALLVGLRRTRRVSAAALLLAAVAVRLPLLATPPDTDCYRYAWEGRMHSLGVNPFATAPDDPTLEPYRDDIWRGVDKKHYATIYPPLAQAVFAALAVVHYDVKTVQAAATVFDLGVVALLLLILARTGRPIWYAAIYAFSPIVLSSFAQAGHIDALLLLPLVLFVHLLGRGRAWSAAVALAAAVLAKTVPAILLAVLWKRSRAAVALAVMLIAIGYLPFADAGWGLIRTLVSFPTTERFNNLVDGFAGAALRLPAPVRNAAAVAVLILLCGVLMRRRGRPLAESRGLMAAVLLLLPIIHFWYVTWVLVLVALRPAGASKWIVLSVSMVLYWNAPRSSAAGGSWTLTTAELWMLWGPFVAVALWEIINKRNQRLRIARVATATSRVRGPFASRRMNHRP